MAVSRLASLWDIISAAHRSQKGSLPTSKHPLLLHDPSGSGLNLSFLLVSLLLLISHHQVQSRRLGHLQCLKFQQLGSVPLSSDSDAETGHQPWAKGPHVVHHLIRSHSLHSSCPPPPEMGLSFHQAVGTNVPSWTGPCSAISPIAMLWAHQAPLYSTGRFMVLVSSSPLAFLGWQRCVLHFSHVNPAHL